MRLAGAGPTPWNSTPRTPDNPVRFYSYGSEDYFEGNPPRRTHVDFDSEGPKPVPGACLSCHGGTLDLQTNSIRNASFLALDPEAASPHVSSEGASEQLRAEIHEFNDLLMTWTEPTSAVKELIEGWYSDGGQDANTDFVPSGWTSNPTLYNEVIKPYCRMCHVAFSDPLDFNETSDLDPGSIQEMVFEERIMPHHEGLWNWFWDDCTAQLTLRNELGLIYNLVDCEAVELCDGIDNNGDGNVDEGVTNACGTCGPAPVEVCDGIDNDCDTEVDEGVTNACGTCGPAPVEVCDGIDNDCDTEVDEGVTNACGTCGEVVCLGDPHFSQLTWFADASQNTFGSVSGKVEQLDFSGGKQYVVHTAIKTDKWYTQNVKALYGLDLVSPEDGTFVAEGFFPKFHGKPPMLRVVILDYIDGREGLKVIAEWAVSDLQGGTGSIDIPPPEDKQCVPICPE